jgi:hypothetical protein
MLVYLKAFSQGLISLFHRLPLSFVPTKETKALGCEKCAKVVCITLKEINAPSPGLPVS